MSLRTRPIGQKGNPLAKLDNVVLAPHIGSATKETRAKMAQIAIRNLKAGIGCKKTGLLCRILKISCFWRQMFSFYR